MQHPSELGTGGGERGARRETYPGAENLANADGTRFSIARKHRLTLPWRLNPRRTLAAIRFTTLQFGDRINAASNLRAIARQSDARIGESNLACLI